MWQIFLFFIKVGAANVLLKLNYLQSSVEYESRKFSFVKFTLNMRCGKEIKFDDESNMKIKTKLIFKWNKIK